eukprot:2336235-Prymnesium_polylepis.1
MHSPAPLDWRSIPAAGAHSLSRATVTTTEDGHVALRGYYGGARSELQMLPGVVAAAKATPAVGAGACGMATTGHWKLDFSQHHWLELTLRSDARLYEIVVQYDGYFEGSHELYRVPLPRGPAPRAEANPDGAYGLLGVESDASAEQIAQSYKQLAMELHPDRGGDEERFKAVSKAFAMLASPERRARYDLVGSEEPEEPGLDSLADWRTVKVPFTAFKDRNFYASTVSEQVATVYLLLRDEKPGPFALELAELKAGRCERGFLLAANFSGSKQGVRAGLLRLRLLQRHARRGVHRAPGAATRWTASRDGRDRVRLRREPRRDRGPLML